MAQPGVLRFYRLRHAVDQHDLVALVELIGFVGIERNECVDRRRRLVTLPDPC
jgi:hypothetical protein